MPPDDELSMQVREFLHSTYKH